MHISITYLWGENPTVFGAGFWGENPTVFGAGFWGENHVDFTTRVLLFYATVLGLICVKVAVRGKILNPDEKAVLSAENLKP